MKILLAISLGQGWFLYKSTYRQSSKYRSSAPETRFPCSDRWRRCWRRQCYLWNANHWVAHGGKVSDWKNVDAELLKSKAATYWFASWSSVWSAELKKLVSIAISWLTSKDPFMVIPTHSNTSLVKFLKTQIAFSFKTTVPPKPIIRPLITWF